MSAHSRGPIVVTTQRIDDVLLTLGWRWTPSTLEGRRRLYDEAGLLANVCNTEEAFTLLEERGLIVRARTEATT